MTHGELAERRRRLTALMPPASLAVVPAAPERFVTGVIPYPYRQAADFYYLTGITQPGVALLHKGADDGARRTHASVMRCGTVSDECCMAGHVAVAPLTRRIRRA